MILDAEACAGAALAAEAGADSRTFTFRGPRIGLLTKRGPAQGQLAVQIDGRPPDGLPVDEEGRAIVDLSSKRVKQRELVMLARNMNDSTHTLTLTPGGAGQVIVDGFVVAGIEDPARFAAAWALCGAAIVCGVAMSTCAQRQTKRHPHPN